MCIIGVEYDVRMMGVEQWAPCDGRREAEGREDHAHDARDSGTTSVVE